MTTQTGPPEPLRARHGRHGWDEPAGDRAVLVAHGAARAGRPGPRGGRRGSGRGSARLADLLALFWLTGGSSPLRFAARPSAHVRLPAGLAAAIAAVVGAVLVLVRDWLSGLVDPEAFVGPLGIAVLTGVLRIFGGFAAEERVGRRWTLGGIVLGTLELALGALLLLTSGVAPELLVPIVAAWGQSAASCCWPKGCGCAASHAPGGRHRERRPRIVSRVPC